MTDLDERSCSKIQVLIGCPRSTSILYPNVIWAGEIANRKKKDYKIRISLNKKKRLGLFSCEVLSFGGVYFTNWS